METEGIRKNVIAWLFSIFVIVLLACVAVLAKVISLECSDEWKAKINTIGPRDIEPLRGDICAIDGRVLATSMPTYSVYWDLSVAGLVDTMFYNNVDSLASCMSRLFKDSTAQSYAASFTNAYKQKLKYFCVKRKVSLSQLSAMRTFPIFKKGRNKSGFISEQKSGRENPHGGLALRTIGNTRDSKTGMEAAFDDKLSGTKGSMLMQKVGSFWYPVNTFAGVTDVEPVDGLDITSTIDVDLQDMVEQSLRKQLREYDAAYGCVVVMEVKTGRIKAISNLEKDTSDKSKVQYLEKINHAVSSPIEPGSTMKLASVIACMEKTGVNIMDSIDCGDGTFKVGDKVVNDDDHPFKGYHTLKEGFEKSSNVVISKLTYNTFADNRAEFLDRLYKMGLNKTSGIDLIGEPAPDIKSSPGVTYNNVSLAWMAFGYELKITPLQMLTFYNAVANNGRMVRPHLLENVRSHGEIIETAIPQITNSAICSKETLEKVKILLKGVVENGTAKNIRSKNYAIAGKTGTALIAQGREGYISKGGKKYNASFVGYFPADNPKYSCIVVISEPTKRSVYGSAAACPVFKEIADKLYTKDRDLYSGRNFNIMAEIDSRDKLPGVKSGDMEVLDRLCSTFNIPMTNISEAVTPYVRVSQQEGAVRLDPIDTNPMVVPNVVGMGLRDAMYVLRQRGLKVTVSGRGVVKKQTLQANTTVTKGAKIVIELG